MSGDDILARVRRAVHMADSLHMTDGTLAEEFVRATEQCRHSIRELHRIAKQIRTTNSSSEAARLELLQQLDSLDCGDKLLRSMADASDAYESEIHTETPPSQLQ